MPFISASGTYRTECEECGARMVLTIVDNDGTLIGDECQCGYYVTRYMPGQEVTL